MRTSLVVVAIAVAVVLVSFVPVAAAAPPTPPCNGLDVAHAQIHGTGTEAEFVLHDLRAANHCGH
jgi:hypothetical protein